MEPQHNFKYDFVISKESFDYYLKYNLYHTRQLYSFGDMIKQYHKYGIFFPDNKVYFIKITVDQNKKTFVEKFHLTQEQLNHYLLLV